MSAKNFKPSLALVLAHEGGFVNHSKDPGGPTNFGVTQRVYDAYRKVRGNKVQSVKLIDSLEVSDIYNKQYWKLVRGDDLPVGLDYAVFDFAVNSGVSRAVRYLQRTLGVTDDGSLGVESLSAVYEAEKNPNGVAELIARYCGNRMAFLKALGTFPTFGKGWTRRVIGNKAGAQAGDVGVIDYATSMTERYASAPITVLPAPIGARPEEVPGKSICEDYNNWPIAQQNDYLAELINQI